MKRIIFAALLALLAFCDIRKLIGTLEEPVVYTLADFGAGVITWLQCLKLSYGTLRNFEEMGKCGLL